MAVNLSQDNLDGILYQLTNLNALYEKQHTAKAFIEFPEKFEVTSDDGYSLGAIVFEETEFVFVAAE
jgi:hypothetical protein